MSLRSNAYTVALVSAKYVIVVKVTSLLLKKGSSHAQTPNVELSSKMYSISLPSGDFMAPKIVTPAILRAPDHQ
jgi:hypothetical protein